MYAQVRHPWRTRPVRVIPKSRTCAAGSQLPAFHSPLFICHLRFNAPRHAASTSMYAQVRHPWRTWPVRVIPKGRTCAAGFLLFAVLCLSGTFDTTLAGTQQVHPCMFRCAILGAQGLYALYRKANLRCWLPAPSSQLSALGSRLSAPSSQPSIFQTIIHPRLNSRTQVLLFSYNQVQLSFKVPVRKL